ncbi:MAG: nicotinate-nucleotide--dimethylbenzimidazole phosphoribosyltransferase [bacterium]|nr:nicotinate-nucleotide--dimethylbenzimidazole phosphoribosyltransferase [bacterium]
MGPMEEKLKSQLEKIKLPNEEKQQQARVLLDGLFKPVAGLGRLEELLIQIAGIQDSIQLEFRKKAIIVMCADNGVVEEGVSQTDQQITAMVTSNMVTGQSSVCRMCKVVGADVIPVDVGVAADIHTPGLRVHKLAYGTKNMKLGPAMTREQAIEAIYVGMETVKELKGQGYRILGTGEMGIGNTTTSSAIASILLKQPVEVVTGRGAGLTKEGISHKVEVIKEAIRINEPDKDDPIDILSKLGGFDIAGLVGVFLGGALYQVAIVIDGVISGVAALLAKQLCKEASHYMVPSHLGKEPASKLLMDALELTPIIHGELALGEGTGAAFLFPMLDMALTVYQMDETFEDYDVKPYERYQETI